MPGVPRSDEVMPNHTGNPPTTFLEVQNSLKDLSLKFSKHDVRFCNIKHKITTYKSICRGQLKSAVPWNRLSTRYLGWWTVGAKKIRWQRMNWGYCYGIVLFPVFESIFQFRFRDLHNAKEQSEKFYNEIFMPNNLITFKDVRKTLQELNREMISLMVCP